LSYTQFAVKRLVVYLSYSKEKICCTLLTKSSIKLWIYTNNCKK